MTSVQEMHTTCEDCGWRHAMTDSTNAKLRELRERVAAGKLVKMPFDALGGA